MPSDQDPCSTGCSHRVHPTLIPHLVTFTICPPCTIKNHISEIQGLQKQISSRGGIFVSRPRGKKDRSHPEWVVHLHLRSRWRTAKIALLNDVIKFELLSKSEERGEGWEVLDEALEIWEKEAEAQAEVPGYPKEMSVEEVNDIVKNMMEQLRGTLQGILDSDGDSKMGESADEEEEEAEDCPFPDSDAESDSDDEEMADAGVPKSPFEGEDDEVDDDGEERVASAESTDDGEGMEIETPTASTPTTTVNGEIKLQRRRVRFTDFATICSDKLTFAPSLFPHSTTGFSASPDSLNINLTTPILSNSALSPTPTLMQHRRRTEASGKRRKGRFDRYGTTYRAGKWASPPGYEKLNTSLFKIAWDEAEMLWLQDDQEEIEEEKAFDGVKAVAGVWVLMRVLKPGLWTVEETLKRMQSQDAEASTTPGQET